MFNSMQPTLPSHALAEYVLEPLIDSAQKNVINPDMHITNIGLFLLKSFSTGVVLCVQTYLVVAETVVCVAITILSSTSYMITLGNVEIFRKISVLSFSASATSIASLMLPFVRISLAKPNLDHIYKDLSHLKDMKWGVFNTTNALSKAAIRTLFGKVVDDTDFFTGALASLYDMCLTEGSFAKAAFLFSTSLNHHLNRDSLTFRDLILSQDRWVHAMRNESANAAALLDQSPIADYPGFTDACFDLYCKKYTAEARNPNELLQQLSNLFSEDPALKREARSQLIGHFLSNSNENMNRLLDSIDADQIFDLILQISDPAKAISNIQNHIQRHPDSPFNLTVAQSLFTSIPLNPNLAPITYQPSGIVEALDERCLHIPLNPEQTIAQKIIHLLEQGGRNAYQYLAEPSHSLDGTSTKEEKIKDGRVNILSFAFGGVETLSRYLTFLLVKQNLFIGGASQNLPFVLLQAALDKAEGVETIANLRKQMLRLNRDAQLFLLGYLLDKDKYSNELNQFAVQDRELINSLHHNLYVYANALRDRAGKIIEIAIDAAAKIAPAEVA